MNLDTLTPIMAGAIRAGTPLVIAALGELVTEKSGVLNLGIEGTMLMGAISGFIVAFSTGNLYLGLMVAVLVGIVISLIHGLLVISLGTNQVATGLAMNIFAAGFSAFLGISYVGKPLQGIQPIALPLLHNIPVLGAALFNQDILVYASISLAIGIILFLKKTKAGLILRGVGESPEAAAQLGLPVVRVRYLAVLFGGAMAGLAGGYLSLVYTPLWAENMSAGRGWIAFALVVFATWKPERILLGAYLFGGISILGLFFQGAGVSISPFLLSALPYLATVLVLVLISRDAVRLKLEAPASLGKPFLLNG